MPQRKQTSTTPPAKIWCDGPARKSWPSPASLHPDHLTTFAAVAGDLESIAIVDAYRCRTPVTIMEAI
jgi:hypothetical protein